MSGRRAGALAYVISDLSDIGEGVGGLLFAADGDAVRWTSSPSLRERFAGYVSQGWPARTDRAQRLVTACHERQMLSCGAFSAPD